jgi:hypothetical protein
MEPGNSVSIVSDYGLDERGSIPDRGRGFFSLASASRPALGPTHPPLTVAQLVNNALFLWNLKVLYCVHMSATGPYPEPDESNS